jgi:hypothetical protein
MNDGSRCTPGLDSSRPESLMRILDVCQKTAAIASPVVDAYLDFWKMTCSVVAAITDVERDGRRAIGTAPTLMDGTGKGL